MAAPVWQTGNTLAGADSATAAVPLPAGIAALDIIVITLYKENTAVITPPGGYTQKAQTANTSQQHTLFWYRAAGGETGTVTFSWTGSAWCAAIADRISGCVASGDPWEGVNTNFNNSNAATSPAVSLGSTSLDSLLHWSGTDFLGGNAWTPPTGFTERADIDVITSATKANAAGGATGSVTGSMNVSGPSTAILGSLMSAPVAAQPVAVQAAGAWPGF